METFNYFDGWQEAMLVCPTCHWEGRIDAANGDALLRLSPAKNQGLEESRVRPG